MWISDSDIADVDHVSRRLGATRADHAAVADPKHVIGPVILAGRHAVADRGLLADHGSGANLDPPLAVNRAGRERDQRARPERGERAAGHGFGGHGSGFLDAAPGSVNDPGGYAPPGPLQ